MTSVKSATPCHTDNWKRLPAHSAYTLLAAADGMHDPPKKLGSGRGRQRDAHGGAHRDATRDARRAASICRYMHAFDRQTLCIGAGLHGEALALSAASTLRVERQLPRVVCWASQCSMLFCTLLYNSAFL